MTVNPEVKVLLVADGSGLIREATKADLAMSKFGKSAAGAKKDVDLHGVGLDKLKGSLSDLAGRALPGGGKAFDELTKNVDASKSGMMALAGPAAAGAILGFAAKGVEAFQSLAGEVLKFQRVAGTTAQDSSKWVEVLGDYGVSADQGATAIGKFAKNLAIAPKALQDLGIEIVKNNDGTVNLNATLANAAKAYASTTDATKRAEIGSKAFGKTWQDLAPILEKGADGVKSALDGVASSKILNQKDLTDAEQFRMALQDIKDAAEGVMIQIGKGLVPALKDGSKATAEFVNLLDKATHPVGGLSNVVGVLADSLNPLTPIMKAFGQSSEDSAKQADTFMKSVNAANVATGAIQPLVDAATQAMKDDKQAAADNAKALDTLAKAVDGVTKSEKDLLKSNQDLYVSQHNDLPAAIDALNGKLLDYFGKAGAAKDATDKYGASSEEAQRATIDYNNASRDLVAGINDVALAAEKSLGPNASATEQYSAAKTALQAYAAAHPELSAAIQDYMANALDPLITRTESAGAATRQAGLDAAIAAAAFDRAITSADAAAQHAGEAAATVAATGGGGAPILHRAGGGPVSAGSPYIIGEVGPELFVPKTAGMIVPNNALGGSTSIIINAIDAKGVIDALAKAKRQNPALFAQLVA